MTTTGAHGLAVIAALLAGCGSHSMEPIATVRWDGTAAMLEDASGSSERSSVDFSLDKTDLVVKWRSADPTWNVRVGTEEFSGDKLASPDGARLSLRAQIAAIPAQSAYEVVYQHDFELQIAFTVDGKTLTTVLPHMAVWRALEDALSPLKAGIPVELGQCGPSTAHSVVMYSESSSSSEVKLWGLAKTVCEVDRVAFAIEQPPRISNLVCEHYADSPSKAGERSFKLRLHDVDVVVYDRATATVVDKRRFQADERCPAFELVTPTDSAFDSHVDSKSLEAWVRETAVGS